MYIHTCHFVCVEIYNPVCMLFASIKRMQQTNLTVNNIPQCWPTQSCRFSSRVRFLSGIGNCVFLGLLKAKAFLGESRVSSVALWSIRKMIPDIDAGLSKCSASEDTVAITTPITRNSCKGEHHLCKKGETKETEPRRSNRDHNVRHCIATQ